VNQASVPKEETRRPLNALACITTGFEITARHPDLIILPLLLDLFLWLGPRLSVAPLLNEVRSFLERWSMAAAGLPEAVDIESYDVMVQVLDELSRGFNLFSQLRPAPLLGVPVLMPTRMTGLGPMGEQPVMGVRTLLMMVGWIIGLSFAGLAVNAVYMHVIGRRVLDETESPLPGPRTMGETGRQFLKLGLILFTILFSLSIFLSFVITVVGFLSFSLAILVMTLASSSMLFIAIHLVFTIPGIVQLRRGPLRAMKESLMLARSDFLNVIFLLALILVISRGLDVVWTLPDTASWTAGIGLAGHAFVSTALTAALFVFYQERLGFLKILKKLRAAETQEATAQPLAGK
jgi:hypothetical protein